MISPAKITRPRSKPSTTAAARGQLPPPLPGHARQRLLTQEAALEHNQSPPNPLWIIAIGMALFFTVSAFLMLQS
jgi:hypothetical protein